LSFLVRAKLDMYLQASDSPPKIRFAIARTFDRDYKAESTYLTEKLK